MDLCISTTFMVVPAMAASSSFRLAPLKAFMKAFACWSWSICWLICICMFLMSTLPLSSTFMAGGRDLASATERRSGAAKHDMVRKLPFHDSGENCETRDLNFSLSSLSTTMSRSQLLTPVRARRDDEQPHLLYRNVLPNLSNKFLSEYLASNRNTTLVVKKPDNWTNPTPKPQSASTSSSSAAASDTNYDSNSSADDANSNDTETQQPLDILGAVTFEMVDNLPDRTVQISLLAVSLDAQHLGIGSRLLRAVLCDGAAGDGLKAAITWSDRRAVPFFRRHGFDDDIILCARYRQVSQSWKRSVLMCIHLPHHLITKQVPRAVSSHDDEMSRDLKNWRQSKLVELSHDLCFIQRLENENSFLRRLLASTNESLERLTGRNRELENENQELRRSSGARTEVIDSPRNRSIAPGTLQTEVNEAIKTEHGITFMRLTRISEPPVEVATKFERNFAKCRSSLNEPGLTLRLYFAGSLSCLENILRDGFCDSFSPYFGGEYGHGWYFSRYASRAHYFNDGSGALLLVQVAVGNTETVVRRDSHRSGPSEGFDSIVVPGRPLPYQAKNVAPGRYAEEYVVFQASQIKPLHLLQYDIA